LLVSHLGIFVRGALGSGPSNPNAHPANKSRTASHTLCMASISAQNAAASRGDHAFLTLFRTMPAVRL
jgi:hypothetical protein